MHGGSGFQRQRLVAIGAILKFAVRESVSGVDPSTVGVVLMVVGIVGLVISLIMAGTARRTDVVHHSRPEGYTDPREGSRDPLT
jgi:hypothetical protein